MEILKPDCFKHFENTGERFLLDISELEDTGKKWRAFTASLRRLSLCGPPGRYRSAFAGKRKNRSPTPRRTFPRTCAR